MVEEYEIAIPHRRTRPQDVIRVVDVIQIDVDLPIPDVPVAVRRGASPYGCHVFTVLAQYAYWQGRYSVSVIRDTHITARRGG